MRAGRRPIGGGTLIRARRCLSAIEQSLAPQAGSAIALAAVMTEMARTDADLSALLGAVDRKLSADDARALVVRCGLDRATRAGR